MHLVRNLMLKTDISSQKIDCVCGEDFKNSSALTILGNAETVPLVQQDEILSLYLDKFCHLQDFTSDPQCSLLRINVEKYILVQRFQEVFELIMT